MCLVFLVGVFRGVVYRNVVGILPQIGLKLYTKWIFPIATTNKIKYFSTLKNLHQVRQCHVGLEMHMNLWIHFQRIMEC